MSSVAAVLAQLHLGPGFAVAWLIALVFAIYVIVDMARHPGWVWKQAGSSKVLWLVLEIVFVLGLLSVLIGILYLVIVRPRLLAAERQGQVPPGWPQGGGWPTAGGQWGWPTGAPPGGPPPVPGPYGTLPPGTSGGPPPYPGAPPPYPGTGAGQAGGPPPYPGTPQYPGTQPESSAPPFGWYPDPSTAHELRYWDGRSWTEHVSDGGTQSTDPLPG